jgi:hypothetical protein
MSMHRIDVRARSAAAPEDVFALIADGSTWPVWGAWDSFEIEKKGEDGGGGVGAIRKFVRGRMVTREVVVTVNEPKRFTYDLLSGLAVRGYRAHVDLTPDGGGTEIHWHSSFRSGVPGTGWLYRWQMRKFIQDTANRVAKFAEKR